MRRMVIGGRTAWLLLAAALVVLLASAAVANSLGIPDTEYQALVALYNSTNGPGWTHHDNWLTSSSNWYGVTVSGGHVVYLMLYSNQLSGTIPSEFGNLTKLQDVWMFQNQLSGSIPSQLGNLTYLQQLYLTRNQLSGTIPPQLGNLTSLVLLELDENQLTGTIPTELSNLTGLAILGLDGNQLSGTIPSQLGNLKGLQRLCLGNNQFGGTIPTWIGNLTNLQELDLDSDQFSGTIPSQLGNLTNLQWVYIRSNQLTGTIPSSICNLTKLQGLFLNGNQLSGTIPSQIGNMASLDSLFLGHNQLSGTLPPEMGNLKNILEIDLSCNQLTGPIPSEFCNLTKVFWDDISYNGFSSTDSAVLAYMSTYFADWQDTQTAPPTGVLAWENGSGGVNVSWTPIAYTGDGGCYQVGVSQTSGGPYTFSPANQTSDKSASQITVTGLGPDPNYFVVRTVTPANPHNQNTVVSQLSTEASTSGANPLGITNAEFEVLLTLYNNTNGPGWANRDNWLTGRSNWFGITATGGHVTNLSLYNNRLIGAIPPELSGLTNLQNLFLGENQLSGAIPPELGSLANLQDLLLWGNQLSGNIPPELGNLTNLLHLDLEENQLTGTIPPSLGNLTNLRGLGLWGNQLSGAIPSELGKLTNLQRLYLDHNQLSGTIPSELGNLANLEVLDLSSNQIVGTIPPSIVNLPTLGSDSSVSYNGLSTTDPTVQAFMAYELPNWQNTQTVPPTYVTALDTGSGSARVSWDPILYTEDEGYYEVGISQTSGGPYTFTANNRTQEKGASQLVVTGLAPGANYVAMRTVTLPSINNQNTVTSALSMEAAVGVNPLGVPDAECQALLSLYSSADGPNWIHHDNWLTPSTPWFGVVVTAGHVTSISLGGNQLSGTIPFELGNLSNLQVLNLNGNQLSGKIPLQLGNLTNLQSLSLYNNQLSGSIPHELGNLTNLQTLNLYNNQLSGTIPPELGNLTNLQTLSLYGNHLSGTLPSEIGNLTNLQHLSLQSNQLVGSIPPSIVNLTKLAPGLTTRVSYNGLSSTDPAVQTFMTAKFSGWQNTQTVLPTGVAVSGLGSGSPIVSWTPIVYTGDTGYYEVGISQTSGGPYMFCVQNRTADKLASQLTVTGLAPGVNYIVVRTVTLPCGYNQNTVTSLLSPEVRTVAGLNKSGPDMAAQVVVTALFPDGSYYVETPDRSCGIRATGGTPPVVGNLVEIAGTLSVGNGELQLTASTCVTVGQGSVNPIGIPAKLLGGSSLGIQAGVAGATGPNNFGLLVRVWGRVSEIGNGCLYIDDGSNWSGGHRAGDSAHAGVMIVCDPSTHSVGDLLSVTGICSCYTTSGGQLQPRILTRGAGDITRY